MGRPCGQCDAFLLRARLDEAALKIDEVF